MHERRRRCALVYAGRRGSARRRPLGRCHPLFHVISMIATLIDSAYAGVAEAARHHPPQDGIQRASADRTALGLDIDGVK